MSLPYLSAQVGLAPRSRSPTLYTTLTESPFAPTALDVVTPPLDGTILPGVTRASVLALLSHHAPGNTAAAALPQLPPLAYLHTADRALTMSEHFTASARGTLCEVYCVGTVAVVIPAARIGWRRGVDAPVQDVMLPVSGKGSVAHALWERLVDIQEGRAEWEGWGVPCACEEAPVASAWSLGVPSCAGGGRAGDDNLFSHLPPTTPAKGTRCVQWCCKECARVEHAEHGAAALESLPTPDTASTQRHRHRKQTPSPRPLSARLVDCLRHLTVTLFLSLFSVLLSYQLQTLYIK
jgi:hypothetical protein